MLACGTETSRGGECQQKDAVRVMLFEPVWHKLILFLTDALIWGYKSNKSSVIPWYIILQLKLTINPDTVIPNILNV